MAKVASSGAEEALATMDPHPQRNYKKPEAFVMSGDALISLNQCVSSTYAKILGDQIPSATLIASMTPPEQKPLQRSSASVAFPSMHRDSKKASKLPVSKSQPDGVRRARTQSSESQAPAPAPEPSPKVEEKMKDEKVCNKNDEHVEHDGAIIEKDQKDESKSEKDISGKEEEDSSNNTNLSETLLEMKSPNEEIVEKSMKSAMFAVPACSTSSYSSPQINGIEKKVENERDEVKSPIYDDVDTTHASGDYDVTKPSINDYSDYNMNNETPSKHSVVTVDPSSFEDSFGAQKYFTVMDTPSHTSSPVKKQIRNQSTVGTSSSASGSPSLHAIANNGSMRSDSNVVFHNRQHSVTANSTNTINSVNPYSVEKEAAHLARQLFELRNYTATDVADKLNEQNDFAFLLLVKYLEMFQFSTTRIDAALREFLSRVELRGESSQRERLLRVFSARYLECNPSIFDSLDDVHTLTCALLLLNSDLHGPNTGKKMTARDFITNIGHTGCTFKRDMLKTLYNSIKDNAIVLENFSAKSSRRASTRNQQSFIEVDPESVVEYYSGYLMRKHVREADGAKTPFGRRSWKMLYARLRGLVLYFDSDESPKTTSRYASLENAISLHHAFAEPATDYKKKAYVFRVRIAHGGEVLLQTSNEKEVKEWCNQINFVAAAFSSPSLPLPVTSKPESAPMPRLPRIPCIAPIAQQIRVHESRLTELATMIENVAESAYPERCEPQITERLVLLHFEKRRYNMYVSILRKHIDERKPSSANLHIVSSFRKSKPVISEDRLSYTDAVNSCN